MPEEKELVRNPPNMEAYVEQLEQILDLRAALDSKLREHIAQYRRALQDDDKACKELEDMVYE